MTPPQEPAGCSVWIKPFDICFPVGRDVSSDRSVSCCRNTFCDSQSDCVLSDLYYLYRCSLTVCLSVCLSVGMLVVNVTWRNKTYVGTLLDCTRHDWAPPRWAHCAFTETYSISAHETFRNWTVCWDVCWSNNQFWGAFESNSDVFSCCHTF